MLGTSLELGGFLAGVAVSSQGATSADRVRFIAVW